MTTITQSLGGVAGPQIVNSYDSGGLITGTSRTIGGTSEGVNDGNTYNADNELVQTVHSLHPPAGSPPPPGGGGFDTDLYTVDPAGRITSATYNDGSSTNTYSYDNSGQLTGSTGTVNQSFSYDSGGNRNSTGYTTGAGNEMTSGGGYTYTYDNDGNTISKTQISTGDVWSYSYDYENRLTSAVEKSSGGTTLEQVTYTYDALGRQIGVDTNGTMRWTVYNGSSADANPYADYNGSGALSMRYLDGLAVDELLARTDPSANTAWYITNNVGSVEYVVSSSGTVLDHIMYDNYGNVTSESSPSNGDRFKFAGMQYDSTTGIYYDHARYYDPNTGRFVSQDPDGFVAGDTNLYRYVQNQPTGANDPSGMQIGLFNLAPQYHMDQNGNLVIDVTAPTGGNRENGGGGRQGTYGGQLAGPNTPGINGNPYSPGQRPYSGRGGKVPRNLPGNYPPSRIIRGHPARPTIPIDQWPAPAPPAKLPPTIIFIPGPGRLTIIYISN